MEPKNDMKLALNLASSEEGQNSPTLFDGAICVKEGRITRTGAHLKVRKAYTEVHVLRTAETEFKGADLYVTLERCVHKRETNHCTALVISSGIRRGLISSIDPLSSVYGKVIKLLKVTGTEKITGILQEEAEQLSRAFFQFVKHGKPYVTLKAAATHNGSLSTQTGDSKWITSIASRIDIHHLRHTHDAILVGVQTVLHDNPFLTTRLPHGGKNPIRISKTGISMRLRQQLSLLTELWNQSFLHSIL